jgi:hypothetical protein
LTVQVTKSATAAGATNDREWLAVLTLWAWTDRGSVYVVHTYI